MAEPRRGVFGVAAHDLTANKAVAAVIAVAFDLVVGIGNAMIVAAQNPQPDILEIARAALTGLAVGVAALLVVYLLYALLIAPHRLAAIRKGRIRELEAELAPIPLDLDVEAGL
jgi:hypothetical protein